MLSRLGQNGQPDPRLLDRSNPNPDRISVLHFAYTKFMGTLVCYPKKAARLGAGHH